VRAVVIDEPGKIRVTEVPDPEAGPGEVLIEVGACGVCGTDLHIAAGEFPPTPYPIVPGHEFAGTIAAVGPDVEGGWQVGDKVAVDPSLFCGHCRQCRRGRGNLCENWNATGDTVDGAFAERVTVPADTVYALPENLDFQQGALIEPVSCAVHGLRRLGVEVGERVLVVGAGTMGLIMSQLLVASGAQVSVVDLAESKLGLAQELGAVEVATSTKELSRRGFDAAVDATGAPRAIQDAFDALDRGGRLEVFGVADGAARIDLSPFRIYNDEITIVGSMAVLNSYGEAVELVANGTIAAKRLISHTLPLDGFEEALELVRSGSSTKVQILPGLGG
jgi:NADPH2:quinone reductase